MGKSKDQTGGSAPKSPERRQSWPTIKKKRGLGDAHVIRQECHESLLGIVGRSTADDAGTVVSSKVVVELRSANRVGGNWRGDNSGQFWLPDRLLREARKF
jgi:hypothetical protein